MVSVPPRPRHWALLASAASLVVLALSGTWVVATATGLAVHPAADAYVESSSPNTNFGSGTTLQIDGSPTVRTYIRFDLRSQAGTVSSARLQLYANTANNSGYEVVTTGDGWTQSTLTFADAPAISSAIVGSTGGFAAGTTTSVDVTKAVHAGAVVDFAIIDRNATAVSFGSGTSVHPPVLNVSLAPVSSSSASVSVPPTPQPSATAVPSPRPAASSAISGGDPELVGAGDICVTSIIGNAAATARLIEARPTAHGLHPG